MRELEKRDAMPRGNPLADARRELNIVKEQLRRVQAAADTALASIQECAARGKQFYTRQRGNAVDDNPGIRGFARIERTAIETLKAVRR